MSGTAALLGRRPARGRQRERRILTPCGQELCAYRRAYPGLSWRQIGLLFEISEEQALDVWRREGAGEWWRSTKGEFVRRAA